MSKTQTEITLFQKRYVVKKSNRNVRKALEFLKDLSINNKKLVATSNTEDISNVDLGETDEYEKMLDSYSTMTEAALKVQPMPTDFIIDILQLDDKVADRLEDLTPTKTATIATEIASKITGSDEDSKN